MWAGHQPCRVSGQRWEDGEVKVSKRSVQPWLERTHPHTHPPLPPKSLWFPWKPRTQSGSWGSLFSLFLYQHSPLFSLSATSLSFLHICLPLGFLPFIYPTLLPSPSHIPACVPL